MVVYRRCFVVTRLTSLFLLFVPIVALSIFHYWSFYWLGYWESTNAFAATDPLLPLFCQLIFFLVLVIMLFFSLFRKKQRLWMTCMVLAFWPAFIFGWMLIGKA